MTGRPTYSQEHGAWLALESGEPLRDIVGDVIEFDSRDEAVAALDARHASRPTRKFPPRAPVAKSSTKATVRQHDRLPHRRLYSVPPPPPAPTYVRYRDDPGRFWQWHDRAARDREHRLTGHPLVSLALWIGYAMGASLLLRTIYIAVELINAALNG